MTQATDMIYVSANAREADARCQATIEHVESDPERDATMYSFADGSVLTIVAGCERMSAHDDIYEARNALGLPDTRHPA